MNIITIGNQLLELSNRINDERGLGKAAKTEIQRAIDAVDLSLQSVARDIGNLRNTFNVHFDERDAALGQMIEEAAPLSNTQQAAA